MSVKPDIAYTNFYDVVRPTYEAYTAIRNPIDKDYYDSIDKLKADYESSYATLTKAYEAAIKPLVDKYCADYEAMKTLFLAGEPAEHLYD